MFPLKRVNTSIYSNKQQQMSHSFHTSATGVHVVSLHTTAPVCCCVPIWTPSSQQQDTQSFICRLIGFQTELLQAFWVLDHKKPHRPPCMACSCGQELNRPHQSAGGPGLSHIMVRLMRSDSERRSWLGDKTKPRMSLTPSPDYFYMWYQYDRILRLLTSTLVTHFLFIGIRPWRL